MHLLNTLQDAWEVPNKTPHFYPGPQPISIERKHFPQLRDNDYLVCEKSDGVRFGFVSTLWDNKHLTVLMNRKLDMFVVKSKFSRLLAKGTVADVEIVRTKDNKWLALIYDVATFAGQDVKKESLLTRLAYATKIQKSVRKNKCGEDILFTSKPMFPKDKIRNAITNDGTINHRSDGLIFTPVDEPLRIGTHETMFKWKEKKKCTVDFLCRPWYDQVRLFVQERGKLLYECELPMCSIYSHIAKEIREDTIVECEYDEGRKFWKPVGIRRDKTHPNNRRTFLRTMANIAEDIKIDEFVELLCDK